ncbi:unnamed protein product [Parnassius mnemosyne]|uniref:Reverse transcriptase domain-containing protein n=1 Tax=Parnassius mnemosyne TaxID=213953 RepID=A0AAV1KLD1_9NEOP
MDVSKTFDRFWQASLLGKIAAYGLSPSLIDWVKDFLSERSLRVFIDGCTSDPVATNAGVPQGSVLSATPFLLHINDLLIPGIYRYADDSTVVERYQTPKQCIAIIVMNRDIIDTQNNTGNVKFKCYDINSMCGQNLRQRVMFVAIAALVISVVVLLSSVAYLLNSASLDAYIIKQPVTAMNLIFSLVAASISSYQIVISLLLLWQGFWVNSGIFLCSLWYVSHLSILVVYWILFGARTVICFNENRRIQALLTIFIGIVYQALFTYFCVVVNRYLHSSNQDRYF